MSKDVNDQRTFIVACFDALNEHRCRYAVLHSHSTLPDFAESDIDIVVDGDAMRLVPEIINDAARSVGWEVVQRLWYDVPECYYYVAMAPDGATTVAFDFMTDHDGIGVYRIRDDVMLEQGRTMDSCKGFVCLTPVMELAYKVAKRRMKGICSETDFAFMRTAYVQVAGDDFNASLAELTTRRFAFDFVALMSNPCLSAEGVRHFMQSRSPAFKVLHHRFYLRFSLKWAWLSLCRIVSRFFQPTGCIVYLEAGSKIRIDDLRSMFTFRNWRETDRAPSWAARISSLVCSTLLLVRGSSKAGMQTGYGDWWALPPAMDVQMLRLAIRDALHERMVKRGMIR